MELDYMRGPRTHSNTQWQLGKQNLPSAYDDHQQSLGYDNRAYSHRDEEAVRAAADAGASARGHVARAPTSAGSNHVMKSSAANPAFILDDEQIVRMFAHDPTRLSADSMRLHYSDSGELIASDLDGDLPIGFRNPRHDSSIPITEFDRQRSYSLNVISGNLHQKPIPRFVPDYIKIGSFGESCKVGHIEEKINVEEEEPIPTGCMGKVAGIQKVVSDIWRNPSVRKVVWYAVVVTLLLGFAAYVVCATYKDVERARYLLIITGIVLVFVVYDLIKTYFGDWLSARFGHIYTGCCEQVFAKDWIKWVVLLLLLCAYITFIVLDIVPKRPANLLSLAGQVVFVVVMFICSKYPHKVNWRPVVWGFGLQFVVGLFILRTTAGQDLFYFLGDQAAAFFSYSDEGAKFLFGDPQYLEHPFAFQVLPVIIFFSATLGILYQLGAMQWIIIKLAWLMSNTIGTTTAESVSMAANMFVGQIEAPLTVRTFLPDMTKSELHAIMTGGFATISGSVLAAYISFGLICSYVFRPVAFLMGVEWSDCGIVGELLGTKTFINEFVAYDILGKYIQDREDCIHPYLSPRSEAIATYALCGFANFGSIGMQLGGLGAMAPSRKHDLASLAIRALIAGSMASIVTACVAGWKYTLNLHLVACVVYTYTLEIHVHIFFHLLITSHLAIKLVDFLLEG
ncbi:PREDICTED: sodium/nucleoside cotransporter 1-like [Priapulus caudatus]|uniref:Sodium/nucleoside cotransporter 1-like n=1 Tax=Priapulus caudatus TaxID=37621 RepID=A0ABM1E8T7_PRICU|nr:PREDICTED: sodium/nucleoside cotransporter 1-like [Priapulus caudatus]